MLFQSSLLFLNALLAGMAVLVVRSPSQATFQRLLVLSGGYLFGITVLHLFPELFAMHTSSQRIGLYILLGFFLQLLLELLSKGVEHGHISPQADYTPQISPLALLLALCVHTFLDGVILSSSHAGHLHADHMHHCAVGSNGLLIGILLHQIPIAFSLTSVLVKLISSKRTVIGYLLVFALASPLGLWVSHYFSQQSSWSTESWAALCGIGSGSLLHIATTIFFEASPGHQLNIHKFLASLTGAGLAVLFELLL